MRASQVHALVFLLVLLSPNAFGQSQSEIERPIWKVGESWTYDNIDNWKKTVTDTTVDRIIEIGENEIQMQSESTNSGSTRINIFDRDFNAMTRAKGTTTESRSSPNWPRFSFPMKIGKTWRQEVTFTRNNEPDRKVVADLKGEVVGWENVTVPAGKFNALKIELIGFYNGTNSRGTWSGRMVEVYWFVPEVKRVVKYAYDDRDGKYGIELTAFKLIP